ncbi:MAG: hypothetical protein JWO95_3572 [Verrucomicrobiales bacterium]|nr:hypothetical protein [Verrucomicrobiales bacterium]
MKTGTLVPNSGIGLGAAKRRRNRVAPISPVPTLVAQLVIALWEVWFFEVKISRASDGVARNRQNAHPVGARHRRS